MTSSGVSQLMQWEEHLNYLDKLITARGTCRARIQLTKMEKNFK